LRIVVSQEMVRCFCIFSTGILFRLDIHYYYTYVSKLDDIYAYEDINNSTVDDNTNNNK
jgi:hypothetical protein